MKKYKVKYNNKNYIIKAVSVKDALAALDYLYSDVNDDRLSPMTYKKLKELGYTHEKWKNLTQEQANKIVQNKSKLPESNNTKLTTSTSQSTSSSSEIATEKQSSRSSGNGGDGNKPTSIKEYNKHLLTKYKLDEASLPKPDKPLKIKGGEVLWGLIRSGADIDIQDIVQHPLIIQTKKRLEAIRGVKHENDTSNINTDERQALRKDIANKISNHGSIRKYKNKDKTIILYNGQVDKNYRAEIVLGPPAGGKSSVIVDKVSTNTNSRVLDSDDIKKLLPEFDGGNGAGLVHVESSDIILEQLVMPQFYKNGKHQGENLVIPIVGKSPRAAVQYLKKLKEAGYTVHLSFNDVPSIVSAKRATSRFLEEGRFLDPEYISSVGNKPEQTYEYLKTFNDNGIQFDSYSKYNNNVKFGEAAKKIEHLDKNKNNIAWEDWQ